MRHEFRKAPRILVADDQNEILSSAKMLFRGEGIECITAETPEEAIRWVKTEDFDLALLDLNYQKDTTSGLEGLQLVETIHKHDSNLPLVVMTAWASVEIAVEAMKKGASDFVTKPWEIERLLTIVNTQCALKRSKERGTKLECENRLLRKESQVELVYESSAIQSVVDTIKNIAPSDANVLITGSNGTGKTLFAKYCHQQSHRNKGPFISVNMGGLPDSLFESELFGHVKGAFTDAKGDRIGRFELADQGTLFLDEIGNLSPRHQATLLRLLESGEFERVGSSKTRKANVRLICATNANLQQLVEEYKFREDLYYRINTVPIHIPALVDRKEDILSLAKFYLQNHKTKYLKPNTDFTRCAEKALIRYNWPGNIRELDHCIERAVLLTQNEEIQESDLGLKNDQNVTNVWEGMTLEHIEKSIISEMLLTYPSDPNRIASELGITRSSLYRRLHKYGLI